jgi:hypothetical protein
MLRWRLWQERRTARWVAVSLVGLFAALALAPVVHAQESPPDSPYFPQASPVWALRSNWIWDTDTGNGDAIPNPGERIEPRINIANDGTGTSKNVTATLAISDTDATVITSEVTVDEWAAGENVHLGFVVDIDGASAEKDIPATVTIVSTNAADGVAEPAVFDVVFSVVATVPPSFVRLSEWVFDGSLGNGDGRASPGEQVEPRVRLRNDGGGSASNVSVAVTTDSTVATLTTGTVTHTSWPVSEARNNNGLVLDVDSSAVAGDVITMSVSITADTGGPWEFSYSIVVQEPAVVFEQLLAWVFDSDTGNGDGVANPGEQVAVRARIGHIGSDAAANVVAVLSADDSGVTFTSDTVTHSTWPAGEARSNNGFVVDIGSSVSGAVTFTLDVTADNGGPWQFDYVIDVEAVPANFVQLASKGWFLDANTGDGDGQAEPGEQIEVRARLQNEGQADGLNVVATLTSADDGVSVTSGSVTHSTWPGGVTRNNDGFIVDLAPDLASSEVTFTLDVTADVGGPWSFTFTIPVAAPAPFFEQRLGWVWDRTTGNDDGVANPGERIEVRARAQNTGAAAATNVVATLAVASGDATVSSDTVTHATWPAGESRNNDGFVVDVGSSASGTLSLTLTLTADSGGPWVFTYTHDITSTPANFVQLAVKGWALDATTGDGDGQAEPGEQIQVRARLQNEGNLDAENVVATLSSADSGVSVSTATVTHTTWPGGVSRNNDGFVVDLDPSLASTTLNFTLDVTADVGGPWSFTFTVPAVAPAPVFEQRLGWVWDRTTGNDDGLANPGERIEVRARAQNAGGEDATNVVATLTVASGDATVTSGTVSHGTWPAGESRNSNGLVVEVGSSASGTLSLTLTLTADNGGPWVFTYDHTITDVAANFVQLAVKGWSLDKNTGDADGQAEPGEQIEVRARLSNEGTVDALNVVAVLSTTDANVTVSSNTVTHTTWPGGVARNNDGFVVDLGAGLTASSVTFTLDVTADVGGPWTFDLSLPIVVPTAPAALRIPADVDADGVVSIRDILAVAVVYGTSQEGAEDVNGDGVADLQDMLRVHEARGDMVAGSPTLRTSHVRLVEGWLRDARGADDGSAVFRQGLPALQALLTALRPAVTALLPNYPNPFNPETWIPFDLSEAGDITIRIYDISGRVIKRLDLGYLDPGMYRARDAAAYWDGRNDFGESVASGVYAYEIRAGNHRDIRRMVIRK